MRDSSLTLAFAIIAVFVFAVAVALYVTEGWTRLTFAYSLSAAAMTGMVVGSILYNAMR